jgi:hypothetical protein
VSDGDAMSGGGGGYVTGDGAGETAGDAPAQVRWSRVRGSSYWLQPPGYLVARRARPSTCDWNLATGQTYNNHSTQLAVTVTNFRKIN